MKKQAIRHGEILFIKIDKIPDGLKQEKTKNIVNGSHGNSHSFDNGKLYPKNDNYVIGYFEAKNTKLYHKEHGSGKGELKTAILPDGYYEIRKGKEFINDEFKPIVD